MFEHMHRDDAIEITIGKIEAGLAVANDGTDTGKTLADLRGHILAQLQRVVTLFLLCRKPFVVQMFTQTRANLQRGLDAVVQVAVIALPQADAKSTVKQN